MTNLDASSRVEEIVEWQPSRPLVKNPNIVVGDYSYYDDPEGPEQFESKCVLYHFPFVGDKLVIGKFCAVCGSS